MKKPPIDVPPPVPPMTPAEIAGIRRSAGVTLQIFALYINVSSTTVRCWERGTLRPSRQARKLLDLVRRKGLHALA